MWISLMLEAIGVRIRQRLTHQSSPGKCASLGRCWRCLVSLPKVQDAEPFEQGWSTRQKHTDRCPRKD